MTIHSERQLIGVAERVDLPDWGVERLRAKIDTGARTSALHVQKVEELEGDRVRFSIVLHRNRHDERVTVEAPVSRRSRVRSSSGRAQERIFVKTTLVLGDVVKEIEVSLASRKRMIFRMLLGRQALGEDFLIDASRRYVATKPRPKKKTKKKKKKTVATTEAGTERAPVSRVRKKKSAATKASTAKKTKKRATRKKRAASKKKKTRKRRGDAS